MERKDYVIENALVTKVKKNVDGKIELTLNQEFQNIDMKTDEDVMSTVLRLDQQDLSDILPELCDELEAATYYNTGAGFSFAMLASLLNGATISANRVFKKKGELRENKKEGDKDSVYTNDLFKTVLTAVTPNMSPIAEKVFLKELERLEAREERKNEEITQTVETRIVRPRFFF